MVESNQSIINERLFERLCSSTLLKQAFCTVKKNRGAPGIDKQTIEQFESKLERNIEELKKELEDWTYTPKPVRLVEIPKANGGVRPLGIPCIRDRVVQAALKMLIEPLLEPTFSQNSYGFRPGRNEEQAVKAAKEIIVSGKEYVVDIDLANFFNTIHHDRLIGQLGNIIEDKRILRVIGKTLRSGIMKNGLVTVSLEGAPQGSPLSPLLSNVVLDELDKELERRGFAFCRFADDCNIFVKTSKSAERVMENVSEFIERKLKLKVNKEKSKTALSKAVKFLGITIIAGMMAISAQSMARAMSTVKELTPRGTHLMLEDTIKKINQWYVGWSAYYKMTEYPNQLLVIEGHIRRRLRSRLISQQKRERSLVRELVSRGVTKSLAAATVYSNKGRWAPSRSRAIERAYSNRWFADKGLKTRSQGMYDHWQPVNKRIKLS